MELCKKHRPKRLEDVVGNETTVKALSGMLKTNKLPHAILFHGSTGCGKTTLARIVRRVMRCSAFDYHEINSSNNRGIETVRDIQRTVDLAPTGGAVRMWMLDEVHNFTKDAQNALLKLLEDTPSHAYFILCTTDPDKLIKPLQNRLTPLGVRGLTEKEMDVLLNRVCKAEGIKLTKDAYEELIISADGSARMALVLLDKIAHLDPGDRVAAIQLRLAEEKEAIHLCRALIDRKAWPSVATVLKNLKGEPESTRRCVLGYAKAVMLNNPKHVQAYTVIRAFERPFFDSGDAGLAAACFETIFDS